MGIQFSHPGLTVEQIDAERDRRLAIGFLFGSVRYHARALDIASFNSKIPLARMAIASWAQPGDYRWVDSDEDFSWIAADNSHVPMDASTMVDLGETAVMFFRKVTLAARDPKSRLLVGGF